MSSPLTLPPQKEILSPSPLLGLDGKLTQVGWSRQPILDCNLENVNFSRLRPLQFLRVKRWDYYGVTTPTHFFSFTLADLGYAGQVFAYVIDLTRGAYHEETLTVPFSRGILLPRNSTEGESRFADQRARLAFSLTPGARHVEVHWPGFEGGKGLSADLNFTLPAAHESMAIVIPIGKQRFYYNRKVNCMPVQGGVEYDRKQFTLTPTESLGNLDWGRGVWEYRSFWVWASASGFLPNGQTVGLNLGFGFGDTSAATENALILNGRIHKLGRVDFTYDPNDFKRPWRMISPDGRLNLEFTPQLERVAKTDLKLIFSEVHQLFGQYHGTAVTDEGSIIPIDGLTGFAEEHHARW